MATFDVMSASSYASPLLSGGFAGLAVDVTLYPIDTLKTRLQSGRGFAKAGGFSGVYRGLGAVVAGSVPTAALFFLSYEVLKATLEPITGERYSPLAHLAAASAGEVVACIVRVPTEIAKQRQQAITGLNANRGGIHILMEAYRTEGIRKGLYRGFFSTVLRDLPFSFIQFPLWEYLKKLAVQNSSDGQITSIEVALCGSIAGAVAGALTTPLDVVKTRIMLAEKQAFSHKLKVKEVLKTVYNETGVNGLFSGLTPRIVSFMLGGFVFFGAYDYSKNIYSKFSNVS